MATTRGKKKKQDARHVQVRFIKKEASRAILSVGVGLVFFRWVT